MDPLPTAMLTIGALLLLGIAADSAGRRIPLPKVTILLLLGLGAGPEGLDLLPGEIEEWFPVVADIALVMIGFLIGGTFTGDLIRSRARLIFVIAAVQSIITVGLVAAGLAAAGVATTTALLLGGIAAATAPAATMAVIQESGAQGPVTTVITGIVAVDDLFALLLFGVLSAAATIADGSGGSGGVVADAAWEVFGGVLLGLAIGLAMSLLTSKLRPGEPIREEAYAFMLLLVGLALWLEVSFLLASMVAGMIVTNFARHHRRPFVEIERIEWPFLTVFFVLAGASLSIDAIPDAGWLALGYVGLRTVGKLGGGALGSRLSGDPAVRLDIGLALLPQAGVALGLALLAAERFPDHGADILTVVVFATAVFELIGPLATRYELVRVGEARP